MSSPEEIRDALKRFRRRAIRRWGSRRVAVAVTVVTGADGPAVLLARRADAVLNDVGGSYPGQLTLPSGTADRWEWAPGVARRQIAAEIGLCLPPKSVLGLLDDYATHAKLVITPVVLWAGEHGESVRRQNALAAEIFAVPFTELDVEPVFVASSESDRPVIRLPLHGGWLHAPTAAVLHQFREVVLHRRRTRVAHLEQPV
ncbi:MAG: NUDIX domain-containing protein [Pseudonocardiaceae bacterium]